MGSNLMGNSTNAIQNAQNSKKTLEMSEALQLLSLFIRLKQLELLEKDGKGRDIEEAWVLFGPLFERFINSHKQVVDAVVCYAQGKEAKSPCEACARGSWLSRTSPVFSKCVVSPGLFENKCANCIYQGHNCEEEL